MENLELLEKYGLFDAKVPRYTSYPPANRFEAGIGQRYQTEWLATIDQQDPISIYVHIPFCRRLCWFCACRTQGTKTLRPVEDYVDIVIQEIKTVAEQLVGTHKMARLHLGGGTPTLLSPNSMHKLLTAIFDRFAVTDNFEFSVEIDPTEASPDILETLTEWGMARASIGVQDFAPKVQDAIGRQQSFEETQRVVDILRSHGLFSLNLDLLFGLPFQDKDSLMDTLDQVIKLSPDRLALYGYAHVPHVSKRQVMIPKEKLPDARTRYMLAEIAQDFLLSKGYLKLGIDHFARPKDSLAIANAKGQMHRNFQGYTDDPCQTLIGFGASAISKFKQGYTQNAVATAAYIERIQGAGTAGHRGYHMTERDHYCSLMIEELMCFGHIEIQKLLCRFRSSEKEINFAINTLLREFPDVMVYENDMLKIKPAAASLSRIIAAAMDRQDIDPCSHSLAI